MSNYVSIPDMLLLVVSLSAFGILFLVIRKVIDKADLFRGKRATGGGILDFLHGCSGHSSDAAGSKQCRRKRAHAKSRCELLLAAVCGACRGSNSAGAISDCSEDVTRYRRRSPFGNTYTSVSEVEVRRKTEEGKTCKGTI